MLPLSTLERAIAIAAAAHAGQQDKAREPYILHPLRVMLRVRGEHERMAAVLHDVVEDTPVTLEALRAEGFPLEVVSAVDALTRRPGEDYFAFVERAGHDPVAHAVKMTDVLENLDLSRIAAPTEQDRERMSRYGRARKLLEIIEREHGGRSPAAPTILPRRQAVTQAEVEAECPGSRPVVACDFYVTGAERGAPEPGGLRLGRMLNLDHHAPVARMRGPVTSTALADAWRRAGGAGQAPWVVINHTDCDSVLSSALVMGYLEPDPDLVRASVCADHTGAAHPIADLLQALDDEREGNRTEAHYLESLRNLELLLRGAPLEQAAERALAARRAERERAAALVAAGRVSRHGPLALAILEDDMDAALLAGILPGVAAVMLAVPRSEPAGWWTVRVRLGAAAPAGLSLHDLGIPAWDGAWGGRWNAGANSRGGGTAMAPADYAARLGAQLRAAAQRVAAPAGEHQ